MPHFSVWFGSRGFMRSLTEQFGRLLRERRRSRDLSQDELARSSKVSRSIISRLESGAAKAVQTDVLDRIFSSLESRVFVSEAPPPDAERQRVRLEHQGRLNARRDRHLRLAVTLSTEPKRAAQLIKDASRQVALWRKSSLCSELYIERWSQLLHMPPRELARAMTGLGEWEDAMFQNSPWAGAWN
jgi:transcriptional regulator with XRE-family HTH domain